MGASNTGYSGLIETVNESAAMKDKKAIKQLASAAARGDAKTVSALVKGKPELAGEWKPIMDACFQGRAESVRLLLKYGADPNIKSPTAHN